MRPDLEDLNSDFPAIFSTKNKFESNDVVIYYLRSENTCDKIFFSFTVTLDVPPDFPNGTNPYRFFNGKDKNSVSAQVICPINVLIGDQTEGMPTVYPDATSENFQNSIRLTITRPF